MTCMFLLLFTNLLTLKLCFITNRMFDEKRLGLEIIVMISIGGAEVEDRQREVLAEQYTTDAGGGGAAVDGVVGVQRRGAVRGKHDRVGGGGEHQRMRGDQPPDVDLLGRGLLREAVGDRGSAGDDDGPRLHHSGRRFVHNFYNRRVIFLR